MDLYGSRNVVEDRNDPTKLGRVRVRCVGYHTDNKTKIPTEDLPWAWVMQNIHTPSITWMGRYAWVHG